MQKNLIRILVLFPFIFLLGQFYVAKKFYEPYPAIVYPAFDSIPDNSKYNEYLKTKIFVAYDSGEKVEFDENVFWDEISYDLWQKILDKYLFNYDLRNSRDDKLYNEFIEYLKRKVQNSSKKNPRTIRMNRYLYRQYYREFPIRTEEILWKSAEIDFN